MNPKEKIIKMNPKEKIIKMNSKEKIIKTLKNFGKLSSARICAIVGMNYNTLKKRLKELEEEKIIKSKPIGKFAIYWELENKG